MAAKPAVCLLIQKLQTILDDQEVSNRKLRDEVRIAKDKLEHVMKHLEKEEAKQMKEAKQKNLEASILLPIYRAEDKVDNFITKTEVQRRKMINKVRPFAQLMSSRSQILVEGMKPFILEIENACHVEDQPASEKQLEHPAELSISKEEDTAQPTSNKEPEQPVGQSISNGQLAHPAEPSFSKEEDTAQPASNKEPEHPVGQSISNGQLVHPATQSSSDDQHARAAELGTKFSDDQGVQNVRQSTSGEKQAPLSSRVISDRLDDELDFIGREKETESLDEAILNRHRLHFLILVAGPAGSGKTFFVRNTYNKADVVQRFQLRAWVNVSEDDEQNDEQRTKNLLIDLLKQVTTIKDEEKLPLDKLKEKVRDFFFRKRFLIVLDDVKTSATWENIKSTFPNSLNGSRMILITRNKEIEKDMKDAGFLPFPLSELDIEDSWKLFLTKVPKADPSLKHQMWAKCKGLPLAIVVLGGLLSNKDQSTWSAVIEGLDFGDDPSKAILYLAYDALPSHLKPCLLYLGLFPKEYVIPARRLFRLWAAEGFAIPSSKDETPEGLVESYLKELIKINMIEVEKWGLEGSPKRCRVPGILYDNVFPDAAKTGFFTVVRDPKNKPSYCRRVATYVDISNFPSDPSIDDLRSYISFNTRKGDTPADEIYKFITKITAKKGFRLLTVLDLEHVYKPVLSDQTIGKLIHLSYVGLRWTFLDSIPDSVGDLPKLETLDVKHTNINSLPSSIWSSEKLRHLYMNEIYLDLSVQKPMGSSSLENLLTLWGLIIGRKGPGKDWLDKLTGLTKLGLTFHSKSMEQITPWISKRTKLRSLKLRSIDDFSRPSQLKLEKMDKHENLSEFCLLGELSQEIEELQLPKNLKMVTLSMSKLVKDPMQILGQLPQLKILRLFAHSYTGKEMKCKAKGFPELRVLKLWKLEELEKWIVQEASMPRLRELEIRLCKKLKEISDWKHLISLKDLTLTNMPSDIVEDIQRSIKEVHGNNVPVRVNEWVFPSLPRSFS